MEALACTAQLFYPVTDAVEQFERDFGAELVGAAPVVIVFPRRVVRGREIRDAVGVLSDVRIDALELRTEKTHPAEGEVVPCWDGVPVKDSLQLVGMYFSLTGQLLACHDPLNGRKPDSFTVRRPTPAEVAADGAVPGIGAVVSDVGRPPDESELRIVAAPSGFVVGAYAPNGASLGVHAGLSPDVVGQMAIDWCEGRGLAPLRPADMGDHGHGTP